jgi:hypothetical protein
MYRARVRDEVESGQWIPNEKFRWEQIALEPVAAGAREDEVAGHVRASVGEWMDMVERGDIEVELRRAVDTTVVAVAHCGVLDGAFQTRGPDVLSARRAAEARESRQGHVPLRAAVPRGVIRR